MSSMSAPTSSSSRAVARWVIGFSWFNLAALGVLYWLLFVVSEDWWVTTVLTYAPRLPCLAPALGLLVASLFWHRPSAWVNLAAIAVVLGPVMELSVPLARMVSAPADESGQFELTVVSCNTQAFKPNFAKILEEVAVINPDVVALQEAFPLSPLVGEFFQNWHSVNYDHYWIGSRYPLKLVAKCDVEAFERTAGLIVEIDTPAGPIVVSNIHQMTSRKGLYKISPRSLLDGNGPENLERFQDRRNEESIQIRNLVDEARRDCPLIALGDFNTPSSSTFFRRHWSDLQSAFDVAGCGYGYSYPCTRNRYWPEDMPWARIDHVLCSHEWTVRSCQMGHSTGSDHRLIAATLRLSIPIAVTSDDAVAGLR